MRVIRTLRAMGIRSVAVFSDADADARHVAEADVAVGIGPAPARQSYLNIDAVVDAARRTGAQAIHPGYGFLSENAEFAAALEAAGIVFIGPPVKAIQTMGDKIAAKTTVSAFGVPVVPGIARPGLTDDDLIAAAGDIGYPGAGEAVGRWRRQGHAGRARAVGTAGRPGLSARREAGAAFGDDTLFLERFVLNPRHIEVQVLADGYGNVVHLGERECSLQRRHQKVIEEAPSPLLDDGHQGPHRRRGLRHRAQRRLHRCRHRRVHRVRRPARRVLLHGDEHPPSGRAPGHRNGHRRRPRRAAGAHRRGREAADRPGRHHHDRACHRSPCLRRGSGPRLPADRRRRARPRRAARPGCARRLRPCARHRGRQRLRPDAGQGDRARRRPACGAARARPRAGRHRRARRDDERRVPAVPAGRSGCRRGTTGHRAVGPPDTGFRIGPAG